MAKTLTRVSSKFQELTNTSGLDVDIFLPEIVASITTNETVDIIAGHFFYISNSPTSTENLKVYKSDLATLIDSILPGETQLYVAIDHNTQGWKTMSTTNKHGSGGAQPPVQDPGDVALPDGGEKEIEPPGQTGGTVVVGTDSGNTASVKLPEISDTPTGDQVGPGWATTIVNTGDGVIEVKAFDDDPVHTLSSGASVLLIASESVGQEWVKIPTTNAGDSEDISFPVAGDPGGPDTHTIPNNPSNVYVYDTTGGDKTVVLPNEESVENGATVIIHNAGPSNIEVEDALNPGIVVRTILPGETVIYTFVDEAVGWVDESKLGERKRSIDISFPVAGDPGGPSTHTITHNEFEVVYNYDTTGGDKDVILPNAADIEPGSTVILNNLGPSVIEIEDALNPGIIIKVLEPLEKAVYVFVNEATGWVSTSAGGADVGRLQKVNSVTAGSSTTLIADDPYYQLYYEIASNITITLPEVVDPNPSGDEVGEGWSVSISNLNPDDPAYTITVENSNGDTIGVVESGQTAIFIAVEDDGGGAGVDTWEVQSVSAIAALIAAIEADILALQNADVVHDSDILALQNAVTAIEGDITNIEGDILSLQNDVTTLQSDVSDIMDLISNSGGAIEYYESPGVQVGNSGDPFVTADAQPAANFIFTHTLSRDPDIVQVWLRARVNNPDESSGGIVQYSIGDEVPVAGTASSGNFCTYTTYDGDKIQVLFSHGAGVRLLAPESRLTSGDEGTMRAIRNDQWDVFVRAWVIGTGATSSNQGDYYAYYTLSNPPATTAVASFPGTKIPYDTLVSSSNSQTISSGRYTAQVAGTYMVHAACIFNGNAASAHTMNIKADTVDGIRYFGGHRSDGAATWNQIVTAIVKLDVGGYIEVYANADPVSVALVGGGDNNYITVVRLPSGGGESVTFESTPVQISSTHVDLLDVATTDNSDFQFNHGLGATPTYVQAFLECLVPVANIPPSSGGGTFPAEVTTGVRFKIDNSTFESREISTYCDATKVGLLLQGGSASGDRSLSINPIQDNINGGGSLRIYLDEWAIVLVASIGGGGASATKFTSTPVSLASGATTDITNMRDNSFFSFAHGLGQEPDIVKTYLKLNTGTPTGLVGYSLGDRISLDNIVTSTGNLWHVVMSNSTTVSVVFHNDASSEFIKLPTTKAEAQYNPNTEFTNMQLDEWDLVIFAAVL